MSIVLEAHDEMLDRDVAIKLIRCGSGAEARAKRLLREAKSVSRLRSRHVASVLDWGWLDAQAPFIVMELLNGRDLGTVLRTDGPLPIGRALRWMVAACDALIEAHGAGIVHRDIKPSNLFVVGERTPDEIVKVLDFGLAKELRAEGASMSLTLGAHLLGTPRYMAPEQLTQQGTLDERADVWAAAVTLYELVTGRVPFEGKTKAELWHSILYEPARCLCQDVPRAPAELEALLLSALEKSPHARLPDLRRFSETLQRLLDGVPAADLAEPATAAVGVERDESSTFTPSSVVLPSRSALKREARAIAPSIARAKKPRFVLPGIALGLLTAAAPVIAPKAEGSPSPAPSGEHRREVEGATLGAQDSTETAIDSPRSPRPDVSASLMQGVDGVGPPRARARKPRPAASAASPHPRSGAAAEPKTPIFGAELERAIRTRK